VLGHFPGLNLRGDRQEEAMDLDPYRVFRSQFASKTVRSAWAKSYGDQFWEESDPPLSQATIDDIKFLTQRLRPGSETKLVDLGCGIGCVGRYLAKEFDTDVEGIDANPPRHPHGGRTGGHVRNGATPPVQNRRHLKHGME
jgi:2-polyprenyl-3-methyl-5-hydroxy-6-metoxy-1,4-benzoquinol methylase